MARIAELEDAAAQAQTRAAKFEKEKNRLTIEIREITIELETVSDSSPQTPYSMYFSGFKYSEQY